MARHGSVRGGKNPRAIFCEHDVARIKTAMANGVPSVVLAEIYEVSLGTIKAIRDKRNWKHVDAAEDNSKSAEAAAIALEGCN